MPDWVSVVVPYIRSLTDGLDTTTQGGERPQYQAHLAEAARLVALLEGGEPVGKWLDAEEHSYGWSFLSGPEGEAATSAFVELAESLRREGYASRSG